MDTQRMLCKVFTRLTVNFSAVTTLGVFKNIFCIVFYCGKRVTYVAGICDDCICGDLAGERYKEGISHQDSVASLEQYCTYQRAATGVLEPIQPHQQKFGITQSQHCVGSSGTQATNLLETIIHET
ncbi:uncharacterized protein LOC105665390 [Ceratitis capitata]|uniref:uncharacterized protein LOC105665390 n=1 Tax=Ceratitis capitata TaxID=7213 RepID=UPI000618886F|nr:uncharacterized protein LOC105665390 [Ceratitis capitata]